MIDYEKQFMVIDRETYVSLSNDWPRVRTFDDAPTAFQYARRTENQGYDVAFAKYGDDYYVWIGE